MCGRFAQGISIEELPDVFISIVSGESQSYLHDDSLARSDIKREGQEDEQVEPKITSFEDSGSDSVEVVAHGSYKPSYNISPTDTAPIIYIDHQEQTDIKNPKYVIEGSSFGLVPKWVYKASTESSGTKEDSKNLFRNQWKFFNCRIETLESAKSMWRDYKMNRCVVPVQGYYEWLHKSGKKIPYYCTSQDDVMFLVGLYSHNRPSNDASDKIISSFTILTCASEKSDKDDLSWLHSRRPMMIRSGSKEWYDWLNPKKSISKDFDELLPKFTETKFDLSYHAVTSDVGKTSNDGEYLTKSIEDKKRPQKSITDFFPQSKKRKAFKEEEE